jgi:hypothetical protein
MWLDLTNSIAIKITPLVGIDREEKKRKSEVS